VTRYLLDVNVLVALLDPTHVHHDRAHSWYEQVGHRSWLSCPTTQNGLVRIVSNPRYSNSQPIQVVLDSLASLLSAEGHQFVGDAISLLDDPVDRAQLQSSGQVTDTYLLALAVTHDARLATFDTKLVKSAVAGGHAAVTQIR
jgi:toxin-antitoxin system PIN domain toxin